MSYLEILGFIASGAIIFGFIVGVFSVYNGRMTRAEIGRLIEREGKEARELMARESKETREILNDLQQFALAYSTG